MDILIEEIKKKLNEEFNFEEEIPQFSDLRYKPFKISENNFHKIEKTDCKSKIAFIDGGNLEILKAADFSLNLIRIYYSIYENNKKIKSKKHEFYALVHAEKRNNEIFYKTTLFSENKETLPDEADLVFSSLDASLRTGLQRINISKISGAIRRFSELKIASNMVEDMDKGDVLVLDGSLQSTTTNESRYLENLFKKGLERDVLITSLSKSCTLMTGKGNSLIAILGIICPGGRWYYHPIADINSQEHQAEIVFAKLHEKSKHIFRFEIYKKQKPAISKILGLITENSNDPVFLGYPYGLIEADRFARISNQELDYFKIMITLKLGKDASKLDKCLTARDAHTILDRISYTHG